MRQTANRARGKKFTQEQENLMDECEKLLVRSRILKLGVKHTLSNDLDYSSFDLDECVKVLKECQTLETRAAVNRINAHK